jgi:tripartite-type tricarboxylate transporter receptor subunit TctC
VGWNAMFAPKGTSKEIIDRLNVVARAALKDDNARKRLLELAVELPPESAQSPAALGEFVSKEIDKWVPIIKGAGVVAQ